MCSFDYNLSHGYEMAKLRQELILREYKAARLEREARAAQAPAGGHKPLSLIRSVLIRVAPRLARAWML